MLDINAKQIAGLDIAHLDNATLLSFTNKVREHGLSSETMRTKLGTIWTDYNQSAATYDEVYNPSQKDLLSDDLKTLDDVRDKAVHAWHEAILAQQKSPNATKAQVARELVQLYKDYNIDAADEYMKETENIKQMIQVIEQNFQYEQALPTMSLDDYLADMKTKNLAFEAKMAERTAGTVGKTKGAVQAARNDVEAKYRTLARMVNVVSSYEGDGGLDEFIDTINAEIEHFKQILARKGSGSGGSTPTPAPTPDDQGGGDEGGGDQGGGNDPAPQPEPAPEPDPSGGDEGGQN